MPAWSPLHTEEEGQLGLTFCRAGVPHFSPCQGMPWLCPHARVPTGASPPPLTHWSSKSLQSPVWCFPSHFYFKEVNASGSWGRALEELNWERKLLGGATPFSENILWSADYYKIRCNSQLCWPTYKKMSSQSLFLKFSFGHFVLFCFPSFQYSQHVFVVFPGIWEFTLSAGLAAHGVNKEVDKALSHQRDGPRSQRCTDAR